jgi:hypothetical protein
MLLFYYTLTLKLLAQNVKHINGNRSFRIPYTRHGNSEGIIELQKLIKLEIEMKTFNIFHPLTIASNAQNH